MKISYNIPMLERMVGDIHRLTGISISLLDQDRKLLVSFTGEDYCTRLQREEGDKECIRCDALLLERCSKSLRPAQHICHAGLYDSAYIKENLQADLRVEALCARFHLSKNSLYRIFREHFDQSVNEYIIGCRLEKAKELLAGSKEPLYLIAEKVGMDQYAYFSKLFKERIGINPNGYRKGM